MDQGRFKRIVLFLEQHPLTSRERQFLKAVKNYVIENGNVTDQQESVLEGIYKEKLWISKVFPEETAFQLTEEGDQRRKRQPSARVSNQRGMP